jgi:hypothetical protein
LAALVRDHDVRDDELRARGELAAQARGLEPPGPALARDVGLEPGAVALALDLAGAVAHADERFERALDVAVRGPPVLLHVGDDGTGVVLALVVRPAGAHAAGVSAETQLPRVVCDHRFKHSPACGRGIVPIKKGHQPFRC